MTQWIQKKYIGLVSSRFRNFKWKGDKIANASCAFCGDSQKNKLKARGYFLINKKGQYYFHCHNCGVSLSIGPLIKDLDPTLYREYRLEMFKEKNPEPKQMKFEKPEFKKTPPVLLDLMLDRLDQLPVDHPAIQWVVKRKIPKSQWCRLFFIDDFMKMEDISPSYKDKLVKEPRIIIPFFSAKGELTALQGRAINDNPLRYVTLKIKENSPLIFGLDYVTMGNHITVVEGPLDSLFLPNAIAVGGSAMKRVLTQLPKDKFTIVPDRQPKNKEICKIILRLIKDGFNVSLMPDWLKGKDINDYVLEGWSPDAIMTTIEENTRNGLKAQMEFAQWKKV